MRAGGARTQSVSRTCSEIHLIITEGCAPLPGAVHDQYGRQVCIYLAILQTEADLLPTESQACNSLMPAQKLDVSTTFECHGYSQVLK